MTKHVFLSVLILLNGKIVFPQLDYNSMNNWVFHPDKSNSLIHGYNLNIGVVDHQLNTVNTIAITNNSKTNTGVDVFFVHPTILTTLPGTGERANVPLSEQPEMLITTTVLGQAGLLAKYGRFFAPRYRQGTPATYIGSPLDQTQANVIATAYDDIKQAFIHYFENHNNGNKIILASHSQGAYLTAMLLRDLFDNNLSLQEQLVTAVVAGVVSSYAQPGQLSGGWWSSIPQCATMTQCKCVMTWRSYKEGQTLPAPNTSLPQLNPILRDMGFVNRLLNMNTDRVLQDSLFYNNQASPLRYYTFVKNTQPYGGNVGFIAFDSLYEVRHLREGARRVGLMVKHTPKVNDQRPNILQEEENNLLFSSLGYHNRDYSIYQWALLNQIDQKISSCATTSGLESKIPKNSVRIFPNPTADFINIRADKNISEIHMINSQGRMVKTIRMPHDFSIIDMHDLPKGVYVVKVEFKDHTVIAEKIVLE